MTPDGPQSDTTEGWKVRGQMNPLSNEVTSLGRESDELGKRVPSVRDRPKSPVTTPPPVYSLHPSPLLSSSLFPSRVDVLTVPEDHPLRLSQSSTLLLVDESSINILTVYPFTQTGRLRFPPPPDLTEE